MEMRELYKRVGQPAQLFGIRDMTLNGGRGAGMRFIEIDNGNGLVFSLLPDRGLDPYRISYKGVNLGYITNIAPVAPQYADHTEDSFRSHFNAGMMTTCGLQNVGVVNEWNGDKKLQHGRFSTIAADEVYAYTDESGKVPVMKVGGKIKEARFFGETLVCERSIECAYGSDKIVIRDKVKNIGYEKAELMLLYHCNLGYPLVDGGSVLRTPPLIAKPRDEEAAKGVLNHMQFSEPIHGYAEQVFYLDIEPKANGDVWAAAVNKKLGLALKLNFNKNQLPYMAEWKMMGETFYVVGLEPGNCHVEGCAAEEARGTLEVLEPGEERSFGLEIEIVSGEDVLSL